MNLCWFTGKQIPPLKAQTGEPVKWTDPGPLISGLGFYLSGIVVNDEALVPAVEVLVAPDLHLELLEQCLVGTFTHSMHGGTHVIQNAHDSRRVLERPRRQGPGH